MSSNDDPLDSFEDENPTNSSEPGRRGIVSPKGSPEKNAALAAALASTVKKDGRKRPMAEYVSEEEEDESGRDPTSSASVPKGITPSNPISKYEEIQLLTEEYLGEYLLLLGNHKAPALEQKRAVALPLDDPTRDDQIAAASKAYAEARALSDSAKAIYESYRALGQSLAPSSQTPATGMVMGNHVAPSNDTLAMMRMMEIQSNLAQKVKDIFNGGVKMSLKDNMAIWVAAIRTRKRATPLTSVEVVTQGILQSQVSKDFADLDSPPPEAMKDISLFVKYMLGRQTAKESWENQLALERLFAGIHQVVGPKRSGGYEYAEMLSQFIRRVTSLAEMLYSETIRDTRIVQAVLLGIHPRWRDSLFIAATRGNNTFPTRDSAGMILLSGQQLTLKQLHDFAEQLDQRVELSTVDKQITFELVPSTVYRAEIGGNQRFYVPPFSECKGDDEKYGARTPQSLKPPSPLHQQSPRTSSPHSGHKDKTREGQNSSHNPPPKREWKWSERKHDPCKKCLRLYNRTHTLAQCPTRDPVTGDSISFPKNKETTTSSHSSSSVSNDDEKKEYGDTSFKRRKNE